MYPYSNLDHPQVVVYTQVVVVELVEVVGVVFVSMLFLRQLKAGEAVVEVKDASEDFGRPSRLGECLSTF